MKIKLIPFFSFNSLTIWNNFFTSLSDKEDVGSSNTITFESYETALAISTICL